MMKAAVFYFELKHFEHLFSPGTELTRTIPPSPLASNTSRPHLPHGVGLALIFTSGSVKVFFISSQTSFSSEGISSASFS